MRKYQIVMKKDRDASKGSSNGSQKSKGSNPAIQFNKLRLE